LGSAGKVGPKHWGLFGFSCEHDTTGGGARWEQDPPAETAEFQRDANLRRGFAVAAAGPRLRRETRAAKRNRHTHQQHPQTNKKNRPGTTWASDQEGDPSSMSTVRLEAVKNETTKDIPMQPASQDI